MSSLPDVELGPAGRLLGVVVNAQGQRLGGQPVQVHRADQQVWQAETGADGAFVVEGLPPGIYRVTTTVGETACRCWAPRTAPPAAVSQLLVVNDAALARGQRPLADLISGPILIGLIIAAAIAIPIAIHNNQKDAS